MDEERKLSLARGEMRDIEERSKQSAERAQVKEMDLTTKYLSGPMLGLLQFLMTHVQ